MLNKFLMQIRVPHWRWSTPTTSCLAMTKKRQHIWHRLAPWLLGLLYTKRIYTFSCVICCGFSVYSFALYDLHVNQTPGVAAKFILFVDDFEAPLGVHFRLQAVSKHRITFWSPGSLSVLESPHVLKSNSANLIMFSNSKMHQIHIAMGSVSFHQSLYHEHRMNSPLDTLFSSLPSGRRTVDPPCGGIARHPRCQKDLISHSEQ